MWGMARWLGPIAISSLFLALHELDEGFRPLKQSLRDRVSTWLPTPVDNPVAEVEGGRTVQAEGASGGAVIAR